MQLEILGGFLFARLIQIETIFRITALKENKVIAVYNEEAAEKQFLHFFHTIEGLKAFLTESIREGLLKWGKEYLIRRCTSC